MRPRHRVLFEVLLQIFPSTFRERFGDGMRRASRFATRSGGGRVAFAGPRSYCEPSWTWSAQACASACGRRSSTTRDASMRNDRWAGEG